MDQRHYAMLDDRFTIETPEQIDVAFDVAGIGARFMAALIDHILIGLLLTFACAALSVLLDRLAVDEAILFGLFGIGIYLLLCGYYIFFETWWNGQTPGKRVIGLRVVRTGGRPIGFLGSAIRNIVRLADFLPVLYGVGVLVMFLDRSSRRLGDMAAGALTVKEQRTLTLEALAAPTTPTLRGPIADQVRIPNLQVLTLTDYQLVQDYLAQRFSFNLDTRQRLSQQLLQGMQARLGVPIYGDPEAFLLDLVAQYNLLHRQPSPPHPSALPQ